MDISFRGGNCIVLTIKKETFVIDGGLSHLGLKDVMVKDAVYLSTQSSFVPGGVTEMTFDSPGDYEIRGVSVKGVGAPRMIDHDGSKNATIFRIIVDGVSIVIVGHVRVPLSEEELEEIGLVDIAVIPVGGNGYTLDGHQAVGVVSQLEPKVIIPTHFADSGVKYEVPQNDKEEFMKELGADHETVTSLKIKNGALPVKQTIIEITRS